MVNEYSSLRLQGQYVSTEILMDQKTFLSSFWSKKTTWDSLPLRLFYDIRESKWEFDKGLPVSFVGFGWAVHMLPDKSSLFRDVIMKLWS